MNAFELQLKRIEIAEKYTYSEILASEERDVVLQCDYFATKAGKNLYTYIRDEQIEKKILENPTHYECLPNYDQENKGTLKLYKNIMLMCSYETGNSRMMEHVLKREGLRPYYKRPNKFMHRYDPSEFDVVYVDDIDADWIKEAGGIRIFKAQTDGKTFTYKDMFDQKALSDYKPYWITVYMGDFNDKNHPTHLVDDIGRRFHIMDTYTYARHFGMKFIKEESGSDRIVDITPIPQIHKDGKYVDA